MNELIFLSFFFFLLFLLIFFSSYFFNFFTFLFFFPTIPPPLLFFMKKGKNAQKNLKNRICTFIKRKMVISRTENQSVYVCCLEMLYM